MRTPNSLPRPVSSRRAEADGKAGKLLTPNSGFTIAEVLVVIGLFSLFMVFGIGIMLSNNRFYNTQSAEIRAVNATRDAADKIVEFMRSASAIAQSHTYNSNVYTSGSTLVVLDVPAIDSSGDIVSGSSDFIIIGQDPNNSIRLIMIVDPHASSDRQERTLQFSDKLTSVSFVYDNAILSQAKNIIFDITVTEDLAFDATEHVTGSATIRN